MKHILILSSYLIFSMNFTAFSQGKITGDMEEEVKTIEELTIKALKLRQQLNPEAQSEGFIQELKIIDSTLLHKVTLFLNEYGWQSKKEIGDLANMGLFLAIQHSSTEEMESFKEIIEKAYLENKIDKSSYALYVDRLKVRNGLPQIYGTQYYYDEKSASLRFNEIEDFKNVNKRRKKVGLAKIEKYAKQNNIVLNQ